MLELIDQSNEAALRYRCSQCGAEGISTIVERGDEFVGGSFWVATPRGPKPGQWVRHECAPTEDAEPKRRKRSPA